MKDPRAELMGDYVSALETYIAERGELALSDAYECGRKALVAGLGILDMNAAHEKAVEKHVLNAPPEELVRAVRVVAAGRRAIPNALANLGLVIPRAITFGMIKCSAASRACCL